MTSFKSMKRKLNSCIKSSFWKALLALFFITMIETVVVSVFLLPIMQMIPEDEVLSPSVLLAAVLLYIGISLSVLLQYGYHVLIARLVRHQYVTIGFLLSGLKDGRRIMRAALLYALGFILALGFCQITLLALGESAEHFMKSIGLPVFFACVIAAFLFFAVIVLGRFMFVWLCLYDSPSLGVLAAFSKSARILHGKVLRLICFVLYSGGKHLAAAIAAMLLNIALPLIAGKRHDGLSLVLELLYMASSYSAVIRMYMALPVFYDDISAILALPPSE